MKKIIFILGALLSFSSLIGQEVSQVTFEELKSAEKKLEGQHIIISGKIIGSTKTGFKIQSLVDPKSIINIEESMFSGKTPENSVIRVTGRLHKRDEQLILKEVKFMR